MTTPTHAAALEYAKRGWYVFPCSAPIAGDDKSGKNPLTSNGKDDATIDPAVINAWWARWPNANVAISLEPSKLVVLDVDVGLRKDGSQKQGAKSLAELEAAGAVDATLTALTGGGGLHGFFGLDAPISSHIGFRDGLDLIANGYVVAAPSPHWSGGAYRWNDIRPITPLPAKLRAIVTAPKSRVEKVGAVGSEIGSGGRNNALFRVGAALRDTGIGREALARALDAENRERCKPPLGDTELLTLIDSIMTRVQPARDVAAGALVEQEIREIFAPARRAVSLGAVAMSKEPPMRFFSTGMEQLDTLLGGGVATRQLCGIIGPPGAGKSAFVGSLLLTLQKSIWVLHASTELPRFELMVRYAAHGMGFPWRDGMKGKIPADAMHDAVKAARINVIGCDDLDREDPLGSIEKEAIAMRELNGGIAPVIAVDYVQLLARGSEEKTRAKVGELTMRLRRMSQMLDCVVIAVFSTGRTFYGGKGLEAIRATDDAGAFLAAAKESGDIEFDCATVIYLDVDLRHEGTPKPARIAVAKCRVGENGFAGARAFLDCGRWIGDPSAVGELAADVRGARIKENEMEKVCEKLLGLIVSMPGRSWRELRAACGSAKLADTARAKLLEEGQIESVREDTTDSSGRRMKRDILRLKASEPEGHTDED